MSDAPEFDPMGVVYWGHDGEPIDDLIAGMYLLLLPAWIWFYILGWAYRRYSDD